MSEIIFIPATTLVEFLVDAENAELMLKENTGVRQVLGKVVKKRRRQSTPVEDLDDVREEKFKEQEARAEKRARKEDKAWEP